MGRIRIHKNAIASITALAATDIEGVKSIGITLKSRMLELSGLRKNCAIKVEIDKNEEISVEIPVIVAFGFNIPEVCARVQENARAALERMTGLAVKEINVNVQAIERG